MKIVERYILRRTFTIFIGALASVMAIVWTTQALTRINLVTDSGQSAGAFMELATLILPSVVPEVIPFALAIAVAQILSTMNADSELVVINAAGSPRSAIIRPILVLALAACVASFVFDNVVDPITKKRFRELLANARADLLSSIIQEGTFRKVDDGLFVQIGARLPSGGLGQIFVADSREEGVDLIYYAKEGSVVTTGGQSLLLMRDGEVQRKVPSGDLSVIRFTSYAFDLSQFSAAGEELVLLPKDRPIRYLMNPDPNDRAFKDIPQHFRAELHRRFTDWAYPLVFALIGLAVAGGARSHRDARIHPMITAMILSLVVRWMGFFAGGKAQNSDLWIPAMYVAPILGAAIATYFLVVNRALELDPERSEKIAASFNAFRTRMSRMTTFRRPKRESRA